MMSGCADDEAGVRQPPRQWRISWGALFGCMLLLTGAWSVATPALSGPDEIVHVRKAEAVPRGQLLGPRQVFHHGALTVPNRVVRIPGTFAGAEFRLLCYLAHPDVSAQCAGRTVTRPELVPQTTWVGSYPPLYYALVGWPSRWAPGLGGVYWMRLLSALWSSIFLATALQSAIGARRRLPALGVALGITPFVAYAAATVNPSALEITAALCLWACGMALASRRVQTLVPRGQGSDAALQPSTRWLVAWLGISGCTLLATRTTSVPWFVVIIAALGVYAGADRLRALAQRVDIRAWLAAMGVVAVVSIAWIVGAHATDLNKLAVPDSWSNWHIVTNAVGRSWLHAQQMLAASAVGLPTSLAVVALGLICVGGLVASALAIPHNGERSSEATGVMRRRKTVLVGLLAAVVAGPVVIDAWVSRSVGPNWLGRYTLPLAVGIPIIAGWLAAESPLLRGRWATRVAGVVLVVAACGQIVNLFMTMRRYAVGTQGAIWFLPGAWQPPVPAIVVLLAGAVGALGLAVMMCALTPPERPATSQHPPTGRPATATIG